MVSVSVTAMSQHVEFGLKGGLNVSTVSVESPGAEVDSRVSGHIGGLAHIHLSSMFALQPELTFSGQGYKSKSDQDINLNYINLPVLLQYMAKSGFRIETGPQLGALISAKYKAPSINEDIKDNYKTLDVSWAFGAGYITKSGFGLDVRYNLGLAKINDNNLPDNKNRVFQAGVFYQFKAMK